MYTFVLSLQPLNKHYTGADPGFQARGAHLRKLRRAEGGAKSFEVFRVQNHDFTPKNHIISNFRGRACRVRPSLDPPLLQTITHSLNCYF
jgi:hypothetical protein